MYPRNNLWFLLKSRNYVLAFFQNTLYFVILKSKVYESELVSANTNLESSVICDVAKDSFNVSCLNGSVLRFKSIKPEGKGIMNVKDFMNGKGRTLIIKGKKVN